MSKPLKLNVALGDVVKSREHLARIASEKISARMSYTLALVLKETHKHLDAYTEARDKLLKQLGMPREENPNVYMVLPEKREQFKTEVEELEKTRVELNGIGKIRVSALTAEEIRLSGAEVFALQWLLKNDVEAMFEQDDSNEKTEATV